MRAKGRFQINHINLDAIWNTLKLQRDSATAANGISVVIIGFPTP
jgi:hypothetical protein